MPRLLVECLLCELPIKTKERQYKRVAEVDRDMAHPKVDSYFHNKCWGRVRGAIAALKLAEPSEPPAQLMQQRPRRSWS